MLPLFCGLSLGVVYSNVARYCIGKCKEQTQLIGPIPYSEFEAHLLDGEDLLSGWVGYRMTLRHVRALRIHLLPNLRIRMLLILSILLSSLPPKFDEHEEVSIDERATEHKPGYYDEGVFHFIILVCSK